MPIWKKFAWGAAALLLLAGVTAVAGWEYVARRIRANEHAPHLVRLHEPEADFSFKTLDGQTRRLSEFKGKTVFLDLWGTWCIQCVAEMPSVQALYEHYRQDPDVVFLAVSRMDTPAKVRQFASRNGYDLPFYTMEDADIPPSMQLNQYPATFLFAPDGELAARHVAAADWAAPSVIRFVDGLRAGR